MHTLVLASRKRFGIVLLSLLALSLLLSACAFLGDTTTQANSGALQSETTGAPQASVVGVPTRIRIQTNAVHIDASVESVGVGSDGNLATPTQNPWDDTGWYNMGSKPGEQGSAVIDGHLDRPGGAPAVFWELKYLNPGDQVMVVDRSGAVRHFRVDSVEHYAPDAAPLQNIFNNAAGQHLNLITCSGVWIPAQHQTTERLVVYTSLVS